MADLKWSNFVNGFANGVLIRGMPILNSYTGSVYYVSSGAGASTNSGKTPSKPLATITQALAKCTASKGDIIVCMPGHAETVDAAADIVFNKIGVACVGVGSGTLRPTITFATDTAADIDIDAANVSIVNFRFVNNIAALVAPIDVNAAGFSLVNCDFYCTSATTDFNITVITDANADDMVISGCSFNYESSLAATTVTNTSTECVRLVGADRAVITDCYFSGDFTTSVINGITTASKDVKIYSNRIYNFATEDIAGVVDLVAGCTGVISENKGFMGYATSLAAIIDPSSCAMVNNYFSNVVTEAGGLVGTAST